ncbi:MAG TPA: Uma2 family endonuclease [Thermoanaerobaculia bacterium]
MAEPARSPVLPAALDGHAWPAQGEWTYEDSLRLPDDGSRYEVIRGSLYGTAAPYPLHQYVSSQLHLLLGSFVAERKLGVVLSAPMDVLLPRRIGDPVQPDIFFLRSGNQPRWEVDGSFAGAPDLVVEVLSPRTAHRDRNLKRDAYCEAGVREYWLVDPWKRTALVYVLSNDRRRYVELCRGGEGETVRSVELPGLEVRVGDLFPARG